MRKKKRIVKKINKTRKHKPHQTSNQYHRFPGKPFFYNCIAWSVFKFQGKYAGLKFQSKIFTKQQKKHQQNVKISFLLDTTCQKVLPALMSFLILSVVNISFVGQNFIWFPFADTYQKFIIWVCFNIFFFVSFRQIPSSKPHTIGVSYPENKY